MNNLNLLRTLVCDDNKYCENMKIEKVSILFMGKGNKNNNLTITFKNCSIDELFIYPNNKKNVSVHLISSLIGKRSILLGTRSNLENKRFRSNLIDNQSIDYPSDKIKYELSGEFDSDEFIKIIFL